ncbi:V-type proton ATPase 16 kDa proteolipid subunit [Galdieria sulphuraria]|uniref:V-type H+-transporting ATPase subunit c n=1 Tax=Galdieria sulphuraria TaxID=130081 RepID=M2Y749_GALSU|nr:V-type H+-transporting ATPase subunit c [Galdieria sulphuraria]EME31843.1 V-type H+-transporting ATPase subunit c [Galdieria sulphuraria]GJD10347.1 V-type proton ATPase 16 kDa proteolipid subunit [Galdieria sulphuraria]|eukprot:XP_005708363.1 V-type H+-transporting ATPase subunit c [Galdieria sulphuraria]
MTYELLKVECSDPAILVVRVFLFCEIGSNRLALSLRVLQRLPFFGFIGAASALVFSIELKKLFLVTCICLTCLLDLGAAHSTAKNNVGVASMGVMRPELAMRSIIPVVMVEYLASMAS